jgi:hypothetical protein
MPKIKDMPEVDRPREKLLDQFGEKLIKGMLADNIYQFVNLMDENGDLVCFCNASSSFSLNIGTRVSLVGYCNFFSVNSHLSYQIHPLAITILIF